MRGIADLRRIEPPKDVGDNEGLRPPLNCVPPFQGEKRGVDTFARKRAKGRKGQGSSRGGNRPQVGWSVGGATPQSLFLQILRNLHGVRGGSLAEVVADTPKC